MEAITTYTVKGTKVPVFWTFKYDLNGVLISFKNESGPLTLAQASWLFQDGNFPHTEEMIKEIWSKNYKKHFEIVVGEPDLSFSTFWKLYKLPVKKVLAARAWERLSKADRRNAIAHIPIYDKFLQRKHIAKAHPSTYINQRYWEDNHGSIA